MDVFLRHRIPAMEQGTRLRRKDQRLSRTRARSPAYPFFYKCIPGCIGPRRPYNGRDGLHHVIADAHLPHQALQLPDLRTPDDGLDNRLLTARSAAEDG